MFGNYLKWCKHVQVEPQIVAPASDNRGFLTDVALFFLTWGCALTATLEDALGPCCHRSRPPSYPSSMRWTPGLSHGSGQSTLTGVPCARLPLSGTCLLEALPPSCSEAANVRHMPEAICFLLHKMKKELKDSMEGRKAPIQRPPGDFLEAVIRPLYNVLKFEARPCHICTGTWLIRATSAPGLGSLVTGTVRCIRGLVSTVRTWAVMRGMRRRAWHELGALRLRRRREELQHVAV
jgi:hypothetical protein